MRLAQSYFAVGELNPLRMIEHLLNPYQPLVDIDWAGHPLQIACTRRARAAMEGRRQPLGVEMQLYFSCVVKKRVLFHEGGVADGVQAGDRLEIVFRTVEALSCDPVEFAADYPERRQLTSVAAEKMRPSHLCLDFRRGDWYGEFTI